MVNMFSPERYRSGEAVVAQVCIGVLLLQVSTKGFRLNIVTLSKIFTADYTSY